MRVPSEYFSTEFKEILKCFCQSILNKGTEKNYYANICQLCDYLQKDFLEIKPEDAERYMQYMYTRYHMGELSRRTSNTRLSTFKSLSKYIEENYEEYGFVNPFADLKATSFDANVSITRVPGMSELDAIMSVAKENDTTYLIFALAERATLSISNIVSINRNNMTVDPDCIILHFDSSNGFKEPFSIVLPSDVDLLMRDYLEKHPPEDGSGYVFFNKHHRPITVKNIETLVNQVVEKSGVAHKYTLKDFRTRGIIDMKKAGVPTPNISEYTRLSQYRIDKYSLAASFAGNCPADLVNYELKVKEG